MVGPSSLNQRYKRVRALRRLARDTVRGTCWQMSELEALLLERNLRRASEDPLDQAWLLAELQGRFGLSLEDLARHFERTKSWVSRRLGLIQVLPQNIQEQVRSGALSAHAAMKYLVPLARANAEAASRLAAAMAALKPTTREVGTLYQGWQAGTARTRDSGTEKKWERAKITQLAQGMQCWHYACMGIQITIRDVPKKVRDELAARAALQGKSMQEFLHAELRRLVARPSIDGWLQQVRRRKRAAQSRVSVEEILDNRDADRR